MNIAYTGQRTTKRGKSVMKEINDDFNNVNIKDFVPQKRQLVGGPT